MLHPFATPMLALLSPLAAAPWFALSTFAAVGAALVAIPIIIHLLNRRRFKVVSWAAMDFLLRAMRQNRKRLRFEQWILLATRCLLMLLFFVAFAWLTVSALFDQLGCAPAALARNIGGQSGLSVIVIDNSYSTGYEANRIGRDGKPVKTHLDQEKLIAKRLIDGLSSGGDSVAIIAAARGVRLDAKGQARDQVVFSPGYDLNAAKAAIDRIELSYAGTDLPGAMQHALQLAQEDAKAPNKRLYLLTDGTRSAWEGSPADAIKRLAPELAKVYKITHFNMTEGRSQFNAAALDLRPDTNLVITKFDTDLLTSVRGFGSVPDTSVSWTWDGVPLGSSQNVKPEPGSDPLRTIAKPRDYKSGGPHVLVATVGGDQGADPLKADDKRYRVVDVASELKLLIVEGFRGTNPLEGSGAFLQLALAAPADVSGPGAAKSNSYISADLVSDLELQGKAVADYRAIALCGVGQLTEPEADTLRAFVESGGTLMIFMGEPVSKENYNSVLLPRKLMPGALVKLVDTSADGPGFLFDFKPSVLPHPFLRLFYNHENTGLDTAKVFTYWQADVPADSNVERVLNYLPASDKSATVPTAPPTARGGAADAAITNHRLGLGHVVYLSTTANPKWTSFPAKKAYVELMHEIISNGVRPGDAWMNLAVGGALEIPAYIKLAGNPTLKDDANIPIPLDASAEPGKAAVYRSPPLTKPGIYSLDLGAGATVPIAVNVPADEADVRPIGNEGVRKALGDIPISLLNDEVPSEAALSREGNDWSGPVLIAVLALLAVEGFMALHFGHYRRVVAK